MSRISVTITDEERIEIEAYCHAKKRWRDPAALMRDAIWQHIARNPVCAEKGRKQTPKSSEGSLSLLA